MRIAFIGLSEFSLSCLECILESGGTVVSVTTIADELLPYHTDYADLEPLARAHDIPCQRVRNVNDPSSLSFLRAGQPDVLFVFGWSQLLKPELLELAPMGAIGTHPALLPRNRGRHAIPWTLALGLEHSGITFFYLDTGTDTGDLLWQEEFDIDLADHADAVYEKMKTAGCRAIRQFLPLLEEGRAPRTVQDHSLANYWPKRTNDDRLIRWADPTATIYNLIRALSHPYIGAQAFDHGREYLVWRATPPRDEPLAAADQELPPGTILAVSERGVSVRTGDGSLWLEELEPDAGSFSVGDRFDVL